MTIPSITPSPINPPPNPPTRDDPDNFRSRADAFVDWQADTYPGEMDDFITEMNATVSAMNTSVSEVNDNTITTTNAKNVALAASNFKGSWDDLTGALSIPASVENDSDFWMLLTDLTDVTTSEPSASNSDWAKIPVPAMGVEYFTSSGTFTVPDNVTQIFVQCWGGGGGGASRGSFGTQACGAGGGGGYCEKIINVSAISSITITVGAGGAGGAGGGDFTNGASGGTSSVGSHCSATGGGGGSASSSLFTGTGGTGVNGDVNFSGTDGDWSTSTGNFGGSSFYSSGATPLKDGSDKDGVMPGAGGASIANEIIGGGDGADGLVIVRW